MGRKIVSVIIMLCMLLSLSCPVYAYEESDIFPLTVEPRNTNVKYSTLSLSISSGTAYCNASVTGYSTNTSHVSIYMYLQKYTNGSWTTYNSWNTYANNYYVNLNKQSSVSRGTYRLKVSYYAENENIVKYSAEKTY